MELPLEQLDRRYEALRTQRPGRERRLLGSIAAVGQQTPIIGVRDGERFVVVDGYKRIRAIERLGHDMVRATEWALPERDALLLERAMRACDGDSAIEQAWFLHELVTRFGLSQDELARRFDRTRSWVSRRLSLVRELPRSIQDQVREGTIGAHAAMKYLVPLARANESACERLGEALSALRPTSRQVAELYATWLGGNAHARELCISQPELVLRARAEEKASGKEPVRLVLDDLHIVSVVARRAADRLGRGALDGAEPVERSRVERACAHAHADVEHLKRRCDREARNAGSIDTSDDPPAAS